MKQIILLFSLLIIINKNTFAQCDGRYQSEIFTNTNKVTINYSDVYSDTYHEMDIYTQVGDNETNSRLLFLFMAALILGEANQKLTVLIFVRHLQKKAM